MVEFNYLVTLVHCDNQEEDFEVKAVSDEQALIFAMEHFAHLQEQSFRVIISDGENNIYDVLIHRKRPIPRYKEILNPFIDQDQEDYDEI